MSVMRVLIVVNILFTVSIWGQESNADEEIDLNALIGLIVANETAAPPATTATTVTRTKPTCPAETSLCVPFYLCGDGALPENQLSLDDPTNACHYLLKCCPFMDIKEDRITTTEAPAVVTAPTGTQSTSAGLPNRNPATNDKTGSSGGTRTCGIRNKDGLTYRITDARDNESEFAEFPWMVALQEENEVLGLKKYVYKCGGSLIHPRVVLTSAHCVNKKPNLIARAGEWDTQTENERLAYQDRKVSEIIVHEGFHKGGLFNDIALLVLERDIDPADNVGYVCLPRASANFDSIQCTASGWGAHEIGGNEQTILKKVDLPIVPRKTCQDLFRTLRKSDSYELHESYLCAGGLEGKDTCKGDGGSPLVCPTMTTVDQYVQAGIVSWGRGCGSLNVPGVYANVAVLRDWIDMKMTERNLDTSYYAM